MGSYFSSMMGQPDTREGEEGKQAVMGKGILFL